MVSSSSNKAGKGQEKNKVDQIFSEKGKRRVNGQGFGLKCCIGYTKLFGQCYGRLVHPYFSNAL